MFPVTLCDDPDCPKCGCRNNTLVRTTQTFGTPSQQWRCGFCGHSFRITLAKEQPMPIQQQAAKAAVFDHDPDQAVAYHSEAVRCLCPYCQARNPPVTRTIQNVAGGTTRYHKCASCSRTFKSEEV